MNIFLVLQNDNYLNIKPRLKSKLSIILEDILNILKLLLQQKAVILWGVNLYFLLLITLSINPIKVILHLLVNQEAEKVRSLLNISTIIITLFTTIFIPPTPLIKGGE